MTISRTSLLLGLLGQDPNPPKSNILLKQQGRQKVREVLNTKLEDTEVWGNSAKVDRVDYAICKRIRDTYPPSEIGAEDTCRVCQERVWVTKRMRDFTQAPAICPECAIKKIKA